MDFTGDKNVWGCRVFKDLKDLDPSRSQRIVNHSPDGFNWGYGGSGPSQLALAILLEVTDKDFAVRNYQSFKSDFIAKVGIKFKITDSEIIAWANKRGWINEA